MLTRLLLHGFTSVLLRLSQPFSAVADKPVELLENFYEHTVSLRLLFELGAVARLAAAAGQLLATRRAGRTRGPGIRLDPANEEQQTPDVEQAMTVPNGREQGLCGGELDGAGQSDDGSDGRDELRLAGSGSPLSRWTHLGASRRRGHRLIYVLPY